jgi:hypothetical protein
VVANAAFPQSLGGYPFWGLVVGDTGPGLEGSFLVSSVLKLPSVTFRQVTTAERPIAATHTQRQEQPFSRWCINQLRVFLGVPDCLFPL